MSEKKEFKVYPDSTKYEAGRVWNFECTDIEYMLIKAALCYSWQNETLESDYRKACFNLGVKISALEGFEPRLITYESHCKKINLKP